MWDLRKVFNFKASKARKCHTYHCVWSLEFHFVMPWLMMTIAVNDPPEVDPESESEAETLAAGKIGVDQELCLRLLSCSLQSGVLAWAQERRGGGDCTNRSKSGSNRGGQIFRSELLSMCNLLKLAHVAPFVTQPEAIHHWQRSGSREQYRPFGTHVFWDGWWLVMIVRKRFQKPWFKEGPGAQINIFLEMEQEWHKYICQNLGEVMPETVLVEAGAKTSEITMRIMKDMGALSVFCRTSFLRASRSGWIMCWKPVKDNTI